MLWSAHRSRDWKVNQTVLDWTVAGLLLVWGQVDLWAVGGKFTRVPGEHALAAAFLVLVAMPLGLRRRWPLAVLTVVMGAIALQSLLAGQAPQGGEVLFPTLIVLYSIAAHADFRRACVGLAIAFAATLIEGAQDTEVVTLGDLVVVEGFFFVFLGGAAWLVGRFVRGRRREAERADDRTARLRREQGKSARLAVAAERGRIARELHDVIAHSVSLMGVQAGAVERVLERDPEQAREALRSIQLTARESVDELRRLLGILRADEPETGLAPQPGIGALQSLVEDNRRAGLQVELRVEGEDHRLPGGVELSAYRVIQEALTNVRKHAPGAAAQVLLRYRQDEIEVCVVNARATAANGGGPAPSRGTGHGIVGMRERVALYGGSLEAGDEPDGGFAVRARLPVTVVT